MSDTPWATEMLSLASQLEQVKGTKIVNEGYVVPISLVYDLCRCMYQAAYYVDPARRVNETP